MAVNSKSDGFWLQAHLCPRTPYFNQRWGLWARRSAHTSPGLRALVAQMAFLPRCGDHDHKFRKAGLVLWQDLASAAAGSDGGRSEVGLLIYRCKHRA